MKRSILLSLAALACLVLAVVSIQAAAPTRPNILYIMADDHAAHAISAYGSKINKTPNIDRLATEGVRFTQCLAGGPVCAPTRCALLTGKHAGRSGLRMAVIGASVAAITFGIGKVVGQTV